MASKFVKNIINSKATLKNRAQLIERQAIAAQNSIITGLELKKMELTSKVQSMLDFAPDSSHSLKPNASGFDAAAWAADLQATKLEIKRYDESLALAKATFDELFTEV